jgi:hypothetical protein
MANAFIAEYANLVNDENGHSVPVPQEPPLAVQRVVYTTAAASAAFNDSTRFVRIIADAKAHFRFSVAGTAATALYPYLAADSAEFFGVPKGNAYKVNFYDGSS